MVYPLKPLWPSSVSHVTLDAPGSFKTWEFPCPSSSGLDEIKKPPSTCEQ